MFGLFGSDSHERGDKRDANDKSGPSKGQNVNHKIEDQDLGHKREIGDIVDEIKSHNISPKRMDQKRPKRRVSEESKNHSFNSGLLIVKVSFSHEVTRCCPTPDPSADVIKHSSRAIMKADVSGSHVKELF